MSIQSLSRLLATAAFALLGPFAIAPAAKAQVITVRPQARVLQQVDNKVTSSFAHSTPPAMANAPDLGPLAANTPMHVALVLKSSDAQEHGLRTLIDEQHDKGTANFHKWVTPEQFGASFGVADSDIQKISGWLQSQGFTVDTVAKGRRLITFNGTSGQVEAAFHTSMRRYSVNGQVHFANKTDVSVPASLKGIIAEAPALHDFQSQPLHTNYQHVTRGSDGKFQVANDGGNYTTSTGDNFMTPGDFAKIYNTTASGMDGSGVTIGIVGRTNILLSDVQAFRRLFGLPDNDPTIAPVGVLAGHQQGDEVESDLDVEWSGAVAPKAKIIFAPAATVFHNSDGVSISALSLVEANTVDIISVSYGNCEAHYGTPGFWDILWEQAAAQGQSVFVSSGDSGAAGCDSSSAGTETQGYGVNVIASSNFNTAVGGTQFNENGGTFWQTANSATGVSVNGYIPETTWNESTASGGSGLFATGGGVSTFFSRPSWQAGSGVPLIDPIDVSKLGQNLAGPHRLLPDVSLTAAGHDGAIICLEGLCSVNTDGSLRGFAAVGGTSLSAPSFAGLQALINQKMGGRQGLANYQYYRLSAQQTTAATACDANGATAPAAACIFNDTTTGNNGELNATSGTVKVSFNAGAGYDLATGLGSVNATNLINNFGSVVFQSSVTKLTVPVTTATHDQTVHMQIDVTAGAAGGGTPTGDVTIVAVNTYGSPGFFTLQNGSATGDLSGLPGGTYQIVARYSGDKDFGSSTSAPVTVTISSEPSVTTSDVFSLAAGPKPSYDASDAIAVDAFVAAKSDSGIPTGTVSFIDNGTTVATLPLNAFGTVQLIAGYNYTNFPTNAPAFAIGSHSVVAQYNGDKGISGSSAAPLLFTVTKGSTVVRLDGSASSILSGASVTLTASVPTVGTVPATGMVTFLDGTTTLGTQALNATGAATLSTTAITASGAHLITASYAGDTGYAASVSSPFTVTVGTAVSTTVSLRVTNSTVTPATPFVNQTNNYAATIALNPAPIFAHTAAIFVPAPMTGKVRFYDGATLLGVSGVNPVGPSSINFTGLAVGSHNITAVYSGDANYSSSTSTAFVVTPVQSPIKVRLINKIASTYGGPISFQARVATTSTVSNVFPISPSQPIQFLDGTTVIGSAPLVFYGDSGLLVATFDSNGLGAGTHVITAVYPGDVNYAAQTTDPQTVVVSQQTTTSTLVLSSASAIQAQTVTLTANVLTAVTGTVPPTGVVTFSEGSTVLGTGTLNAGGVATLSTSFLTSGAHIITASYPGDANYLGSSTTGSASSTVTVTPAFTLSANPASVTVKHGTDGSFAISVAPGAGFQGSVSFACTNLPANATCVFTPATASFASSNAAQTIQVTVHTRPVTVAMLNSTDGDMSPIPALAFWLPGAALSGFGLGRKRSARQRQMLLLAIFALGLGGMLGMTGCGSSGTTAAPGTYNVQVTGTSNGVTNTVPVSITIS